MTECSLLTDLQLLTTSIPSTAQSFRDCMKDEKQKALEHLDTYKTIT